MDEALPTVLVVPVEAVFPLITSVTATVPLANSVTGVKVVEVLNLKLPVVVPFNDDNVPVNVEFGTLAGISVSRNQRLLASILKMVRNTPGSTWGPPRTQ